MKKPFALFLAAALACAGASAQQADIRQAAERYKAANTLTAKVRQTRHNAALTDDVVADGHFYYKKPNSESMVFEESGEMLLATDNTFVMVRNGKQRIAKAEGKGNNPFETLRDVFRNLLAAGDGSRLTDMADVTLKTQGSTYTITIAPAVTDPKMKRKMMFTSCIVTIDLKAGELRSVRINEQGENYTQYDFSDYVFDAAVSDQAFDPQAVM